MEMFKVYHNLVSNYPSDFISYGSQLAHFSFFFFFCFSILYPTHTIVILNGSVFPYFLSFYTLCSTYFCVFMCCLFYNWHRQLRRKLLGGQTFISLVIERRIVLLMVSEVSAHGCTWAKIGGKTMWAPLPHGNMEIRGQPMRASSLPPPCGS